MAIGIELMPSLRLALRAHYINLSFLLFSITIASVLMSAQFSARHPSTAGLDVGLSLLRFVIPFLATLLMQELLVREFDRKLYLTSLTYPRPRHLFLLERVITIAILSYGLLIVLASLIAGLATWIDHSYTQATPPGLGLPYVVTIAFIALDLLVVLAIGTLIAVTTITPSFVLIGTLGFMLVARSYSAIVALLTRDTTLVGNADTYQSSLSLLGYLLPDLAALDVRMISLYGDWQFLPDDWPLRVISTLAYAAALFALSVWALNRKKFA